MAYKSFNSLRHYKEAIGKESINKAIVNVCSLVSKRIQKPISVSNYSFDYTNASGDFTGVLCPVGKDQAIRFNWKLNGNSANVESISFWLSLKKINPTHELNTEKIPLVKLIDIISEIFLTGKSGTYSILSETLKMKEDVNILSQTKGQVSVDISKTLSAWATDVFNSSNNFTKALEEYRMKDLFTNYMNWYNELPEKDLDRYKFVNQSTFLNYLGKYMNQNGIENKFSRKVQVSRASAEMMKVEKSKEKDFKDMLYDLTAEDKFNMLKAMVRSVAKGVRPGFMVIGKAGCLVGDSIISINRNSKGYKLSLEELYYKFNNKPYMQEIKLNGKLIKKSSKAWQNKEKTYIRSYDEKNNFVFLNEIINVYESGLKPIYKLILENGIELEASFEHKILTSNRGWVCLGELNSSDYVYSDTLTRHKKTSLLSKEDKKENKKRWRDKFTPIGLYYPNGKFNNRHQKTPRYVGREHHIVYEAFMNNLSLQDFIEKTNIEEEAKTLKYIDTKKYCIHHKDHNHKNNDLYNLELMTHTEHAKYHTQGYKNFKHGIPEKIKVEEVIDLNQNKMTYDIECKYPYNNFTANSIVVHNTGKTTAVVNTMDEEGVSYVPISGAIKNARALFEVLAKHNKKGRIILFDDSDSMLRNKECVNILKSATDTTEAYGGKRIVTYVDNKHTVGATKNKAQIVFESGIILIANLPKNKIDDALQSRLTPLEIDMDKSEMLDYIKTKLEDVLPEIPMNYKVDVWNFINNEIANIRDIDFRRFMSAVAWRVSFDTNPAWKKVIYNELR